VVADRCNAKSKGKKIMRKVVIRTGDEKGFLRAQSRQHVMPIEVSGLKNL